MNKTSKIVTGLLVACLAFMYVYILMHPTTTVTLGGASSATGTTFGTARIAAGVYNATFSATGSDVIFSALNTDSTDRVITSVVGTFSGPLSITSLYMATSTSATATTTTSYILNNGVSSANSLFLLSTTSPTLVSASGDQYRIWPTGTYLNFMLGTTSTTTGMIGVTYLAQ